LPPLDLPVAVFADQLSGGGGTGRERVLCPNLIGALEELLKRDPGTRGEAAAQELDGLSAE